MGETGGMLNVVIGLLAVVAVALAVVTLVMGNRGQLVFESRKAGYRTPESIKQESRWAALEYVGGAVTIIGLIANLAVVAVLGLVAAAAGYVMVMAVRRAAAR